MVRVLGCEYCTISPSTRVLSIANSPALNPYPVSHPNPPGVSGSDAPSLGGPLGQEPVSLSLFVPSRLKASVLSWRCTGCTAWCTPRERGVHSWRCTGGTAWCTPRERGVRSWRCTGCTAWCTPRERGVRSWRCTQCTAWCTPRERGTRGCCIYLLSSLLL